MNKNHRGKVLPIMIDGQYLGEIDNGYIQKHVRASVDMLKKPIGWTWDKRVIEFAEKKRIQNFAIVDDETTNIYLALLSDFRKYGKPIDRGFGKEIFLPIKHWIEII